MKYLTTLIMILLLNSVTSLSFAEDTGSYSELVPSNTSFQKGKFESKVEFEKVKDVVKVISGTIGVSPYDSMVKAGLSDNIANEIIRQFSYFINFRTDIHIDDVFNVKYSENKSNENDTSTTTNLLFASVKTAKKTYKIYRFNDKYYNEKGESIKNNLNIMPLAVHNAQISPSKNGVNYIVPKGTAVYASGNGIIEVADNNDVYGNYIKIHHNSEYETLYGYLLRFASGIRSGVNVKKAKLLDMLEIQNIREFHNCILKFYTKANVLKILEI